MIKKFLGAALCAVMLIACNGKKDEPGKSTTSPQ